VADKRFVILEELGKGGHGKVYRARDEQLGRIVAIKVFHDSRSEGTRLMKEARTLCQLTHPGIVNVHDVSRISIDAAKQTTITLSEEDGVQEEDQLTWAMIMEDLGNTDSQQYVKEYGEIEALRIVAEIADALETAHARGIFHGDLNNNNVRIVRGKAKVFDFSLAARVPGRPYGTPAYRAPEQTRGEDPTDRTDVYGLGGLLQRLLGQDQMEASRPERSDYHRRSTLDHKTRKKVEGLIQRMLDPDPSKRPSMVEVARVCRDSTRDMSNWGPLPRAASVLAIVLAVSGSVLFSKIILLRRGASVEAIGSRENTAIPISLRVAVGIAQQGKNILMVRRRHKEGPLSWQFPAGIVKPLQEPEQRVLDEVLEETGIRVKVIGKLGERVSPDTKAHVTYFHCHYLAGELRNGEPNENAEVAWVPADEVEDYVTSDLYSGVVDLLKEIKNGHAR